MDTRICCKLLLPLAWGTLSVQAQGAFDWTWRNPLPHGEYARGAAWTGSQVVAVGMINSVRTSPDGRTWTQRDLKENELWGTSLHAVAWTGSMLVGAGGFGRISVSTDGISWSEKDSPVLQDLHAICWTGSLLVAVGDGGSIATSPDGTTWKQAVSGTSKHLKAVTRAGDRIVAAGEDGVVLTSTDGAAWTAAVSGTTQDLLSLAWTGALVVAGGDQVTLTSTNGTAWTAHAQTSIKLASLLWTGSRLVGVGYPGPVWTSPDGVEWTEYDLGEDRPSFYCLVKTGTEILALGEAGYAFASPDGSTWTPIGSGTRENLNDVIWNGSAFLAVGDRGLAMTSPDGAAWTKRTTPSDRQLNGVVWTGSQYVAVGYEGAVLTSPDGSSWTLRDPGTDHDLIAVAWSGALLVAVGERGISISNPPPPETAENLWTSPDGITWTPRSTGKDANLRDVTWTGSQWVAVGDLDAAFKSVILTSPDGLTWTARTPPKDRSLSDVIQGGNHLLALGDGGTYLRSTDGITWADTGLGMGSMAAVWTGTQWVAAEATDRYFTSPDALSWTRQTSRVGAGIRALAWNGTLLAAVGNRGDIVNGSRRQNSIRKYPRGGSIGLRISSRRIEVSLPQAGKGLAGRGEAVPRVRLVSANGAVSREPESVSASGARFSALGLPAGVYFVRWEANGQAGAQALAIAP